MKTQRKYYIQKHLRYLTQLKKNENWGARKISSTSLIHNPKRASQQFPAILQVLNYGHLYHKCYSLLTIIKVPNIIGEGGIMDTAFIMNPFNIYTVHRRRPAKKL